MMKKIIFISFLLILITGLTGCFGQTVAIPETPNEISNSPVDKLEETANKQETEVSTKIPESDFEVGSNAPVEPSNSGNEYESVTDTEEETKKDTVPIKNNNVIEQPVVQTANIILEAPLPNSTVTSPFEVRGQARVFEGTILVRVRNQDGKIIIPEQIVNVHAQEQGEFGTFKIKINYQFYATKEGTIEVFSQSPEDGREINMLEVPVKFE